MGVPCTASRVPCSRHEQVDTNRRANPIGAPLVSKSLQSVKRCQECSLLGGLLALLALLLAFGRGGLLLDAVKLLDHESSGDSAHKKKPC